MLLPLVQRCLNSLTRSVLGCSANALVFGNRVNLDRYIIPAAPVEISDDIRLAVSNSDTVQSFTDTLFIAQQDLLHKAEQIRVKLVNDNARSRPVNSANEIQEGTVVLVPWNDQNQRPNRLCPNFMGPYVVVRAEHAKGTVALSHTIVPKPTHEPQNLVSAITELRIYNDELAIADYDIPEDRFRQLAYVAGNARPINCILSFRRLPFASTEPENNVNNFEYQVRFEDSANLDDVAWLPYSAVHHSFAFEAFYQCARLQLSGHQCVAIPSEHRQVHQRRSSAAHSQRQRLARQAESAASFNMDSLSFAPGP
jgi:hypothetical protein